MALYTRHQHELDLRDAEASSDSSNDDPDMLGNGSGAWQRGGASVSRGTRHWSTGKKMAAGLLIAAGIVMVLATAPHLWRPSNDDTPPGIWRPPAGVSVRPAAQHTARHGPPRLTAQHSARHAAPGVAPERLMKAAAAVDGDGEAWSKLSPAQVAEVTKYDKSLFDSYSDDKTPHFNRRDGNVCADNEELHGGLCYKKCSLLTDSSHPFRSTPWTCCKANTCNPFRDGLRHDLGICSGYDVSSNDQGHEACPHSPGACLANEELLAGVCYKKCSVLTRGVYAFRWSPVHCCKTTGVRCTYPPYVDFSLSYRVAGGKDDMDPTTPADPHRPIKELTEVAA